MSTIRMTLLLFIGVGAGLWLSSSTQSHARNAGALSAATPTILQVQTLSSLVTTTVHVCDVIESQISGRTGSVRAAVLIKGDILQSVDLTQARFAQFDNRGRFAVLMLPQPQAQNPRVNHESTRVFAVQQDGLWSLVPGDAAVTAVTNLAYREAQHLIVEAGRDAAALRRAKQHAESEIQKFFATLGWNVELQWM